MDSAKEINPCSQLVEKYEKYLNEVCKVSFRFYNNCDSKMLKLRDLTGLEKYKVFSTVPQIFPSLLQADKVQDIWNSFFKI